MFIPLTLLVPILVLAAIPLLVIAVLLHHEATRAGLCLIGPRDQFLDDSVLITRWCILYVPVWTIRGCHSTGLFE